MTEQRKKGLALIVVIGVLAIAGIIAVTFAEIMLLQRREASNFLNSVKAQYIAEGGIAKAIADFRSRVPLDGYGTLKTYISNYVATYGTNVTLGSGRYTLDIQSEEDYFGPKVNINTFDWRDTSQIARLQAAGLPTREIANIIDYRDYDNSDSTQIPGPPPGNGVENANCKNQPYNSIGEVKMAFLNAGATMTNANTWYNLIKDIITIDKPIIRGGLLAKYYGNIDGVSPGITIDETSYAGEIVELGVFDEYYIEGGDADDWDQDSGWNESHDAEFTGGYLLDSLNDFGLTTFAVRWEGYIEIYPAEVGSAITFRVRVDDGARLFINGDTNLLPAAAWQNQGQTDYSGTYTFRSPGWHRIKIEYYDYTGPNTLRLRWGGADFNSATTIPAERFGYEPPTEQIPASTTAYPYNHAGNYKIIATAQVLSGTSVIAEKRLSATAKVFGTWTQTMRAEWHAAWASEYAVGVPSGYTNADGFLPGSGGNDYRDGEARNVTWLDSCPLNATDDLEAPGYFSNLDDLTKFQRDSLKLGFWADFEDDPGYTACNLKALTRSEKWGSDDWINIVKDDGLHNFFFISWGDVRDEWHRTNRAQGSDGNQELIIATAWHEARRFEVNPFYYFPSGSDPATFDGTPDVFMRAWTAIYPMPGLEAKAYWKGNGTELIVGVTPGFDGFNSSGNPTGTRVGSIPVSGGSELIDTAYSGTGFYGWAYDWLPVGSAPDGKYQIGERINKVWPIGVSRDYSDNNVRWGTNRKAVYGTNYGVNPPYDVDNQTGVYSYWQPDIPFTTPMIYVAGERLDYLFGGPGAGARGFGLMEKDSDSFWNTTYSQMEGWSYPDGSDMLELTLDSSTGASPPYNNRVGWLGLDFDHAPVLAIIGLNGSYIGWVKGRTPLGAALERTAPQSGSAIAATTSVTTPNFQFLSRNVYDVNGEEFSKWMVAEDVVSSSRGGQRLYRTGGNADQFPLDVNNDTSMTTYYDNIRIIPASGFLVSTPFFGGETVLWGTVSYTVNTPANTAVAIYLRAAGFAGLPTNDTFSTSFANGAPISSTPDRWIQYKAVLSSTAFNPGSTWNTSGGVTPRLDDITITYNPTVQILSWKDEP